MDYEKKYKEALKKAEAFYYSATTEPIHEREVLANIFPELKESEDERIRKALKEYFINSFQNNGVAAICGVHIKDVFAWLEKQGEQKPFDYENANIQQKDFAPKSQRMMSAKAKEALYGKPTWSEEDEKMYLSIMSVLLSTIGTDKAGFTVTREMDWLKSLKERYTWKPSDEQIELLEMLVEDNNQRYFYTTLNSLYQQLKKLREG